MPGISTEIERTWLGSHSGRLPTQAKQLGGIENEFENKINHTVFLGKQPVIRLFSCRRGKTPLSSLNLKLQRPGCYYPAELVKNNILLPFR